MALTAEEKAGLNNMCPAAKKVALGDKVDAFVQGVLAEGSVGTSEIADDAVTKAKIGADVAGNGLGQNADGSLEVKVDDSTLEIATDSVQVKDGGIAAAKLESALQALILGAAAGYKLARGTAAVTGSADVNTGLATVVAVVASFHDAPSVDAMFVQAKAGSTAGHIDLVVTKPTAVNNVTPTASTTETNVDWIAIGT
jgi:hypothetical protein